MSNYNTQLQTHNSDLQTVLQTLQTKASGVKLPNLTDPANASELLSGKELIDQEGKILTGSMPNNGSIALTMDGIDTKTISIPEGYTSGGTISLDGTIDEEVEEQTDLIEQIKNVANNLPEAGSSGNGSIETVVGTIKTNAPILPGESQLGSTVYYIDGNGSLQNTSALGTISVMKNSIIVSHSNNGNSSSIISGNAVRICYFLANIYAFHVLGDFTIKI